MAKLIMDWLNDEVVLSRPVTDLDHDFCDGYLLGELLNSYNQQDNFDRFLNRDNPDARINNFCLLEPTMRQIGVVFNSLIAFNIMHAKPGQMKNLLFEIKTSLDKIAKGGGTVPGKVTGEKTKPMRVLHSINPVYDSSIHATFEKVVRRDIENPSEVLMQKNVTAYFDEKGRQYEEWLATGKSNDYAEHRAELMRKKELAKQRAKHEAEFMATWNEINEEQWRKNQARALTRKATYAHAAETLAMKRQTARAEAHENARTSTLTGIDEFEERMRTRTFVVDAEDNVAHAIKTAGGHGDEGLPELMHMDKDTLNEGLLVSQKTIKQNYDEFLEKQQVHGRRRRKFIRERESFHSHAIQSAAQSEIVHQLLNTCEGEKVEESARKRVLANRQVMETNANNRAALVQDVKAKDRELAGQRFAEEARREFDWVVTARLEAQKARLDVFREAKRAADAQMSLEVALDSVDRLLDVVDWVSSCRAIGAFRTEVPAVDSGEATAEGEGDGASSTASTDDPLAGSVIPGALWADAAHMFTSQGPVATAMPFPQPSNIYEELPASLSARPVCANAEWLIGQGTTTGALALQAEGGDANMSQAILADVLEKDVESFLAHLSNAAVGGDEPPETVDREPSPALSAEDLKFNVQKVLMESPSWLRTTPSKRVFGRMLAELRCVVAPLPEDPKPRVDQPSRPLRLVVAGASDRARALAARAVAAKMGAGVINAQELVVAAAKRGSEIAALKESGAWQDEPETATASEAEGQQEWWPEPEPPRVEGEGEAKTEADGGDAAASTEDQMAVTEPEPEPEPKSEPEAVPAVPEQPALPERGSADFLALEKARLQRKNKDDLSLLAYAALSSGLAVADATVAGLVAHAVAELPEGEGFVLEDFVNTKDQLAALMEALSGIDYTAKRPTFSDRASAYAPLEEDTANASYDLKCCGLDGVVFIDVQMEELVVQRVQLRLDLAKRAPGVDPREAETCVTADTKDVTSLVEVSTPLRPVHSTSITAESHADSALALRSFLTEMNLLHEVSLTIPNNGGTDYPAGIAEQETAQAAVEVVERLLNPEQQRPAAGESEASVVAEGEGGGESAEPAAEPEPAPEPELDEEGHPIEPPFVPSVLPTITDEVTVVKALATALADMWALTEKQSRGVLSSFFTAMRDVRYHMLHRRRAVADAILSHTVRRGNHQEVYDTFRDEFNAVEDDFRFDPEVRAELALRATQLRETLSLMAESRRDECAAVLSMLAADGALGLLQHTCQCEAAALLQAEADRFNTSLHVMQDFAKASAGYERSTRFVNELEETLAEDAPPVDPKAKGKGGKDAGSAPFRAVFAPEVMQEGLLKAVPAGGAAVEEEDPKAKGKDKGKKGGEAVPETPMDTSAAACLALVDQWSKDAFTANRDLYNGDEALCVALENAVWVEAERLRSSVAFIKDLVTSQINWLGDAEKSGLDHGQSLIDAAYMRELAATERLTVLVVDVISDCSPIVTDWLVAPDAIAIRKSVRLTPAPEPAPAPVPEEYNATTLSGDQLGVAMRELEGLCLGGVTQVGDKATSTQGVIILMQDALAWAERTCAATATGSLSSCSVSAGGTTQAESEGQGVAPAPAVGTLNHIRFPAKWQEVEGSVLGSLVEAKAKMGLPQAAGVTSVEEVLASLNAFSEKVVSSSV